MINIIQNTIGALGRTLGIVRKNLQLWLDFNKSEVIGSELVVKDKSPNTNNAKLFTGKALSFDGVNDVVEVTDNGNINLGTSDFTFAFWINKLGSGGSTQRVIDKRNIKGYTLYLDNINVLRLELNDGSGNVGFVMGTLTDDTFQRVVISGDRDGNATCYINNSPQTPIDISSKQLSLDDPTNLFIGADAPYGNNFFFSGNLSDLQIYNKAWTADDVAFDYNNPNHLAIDNPDTDLVVTDLKAYWALSEGDGLVAYDSSGEGNNGTINGATYVTAQPTIPQLGMMDWAKGSNLYLSSEPTANESAAGDISYGSYSWGLNGFSNATIFGDNSVLRYRYGGSTTIGVEYTLSAFVIMDDNSEPDVTNLSSSGDFSLVVSGSVGVGVISKTNISGNIWRVSKVKTAVDSTTSNGIVKYTTQSAKGFKVVGYQLEESSSAGNYILTDGAAAIDVTTIQNPTNKGYDILGNALRLREHAFNLDGSGYAEIADNDSLDMNEGFSVSFWRKLDVSTDGVRSALVTKGVGLSTGTDYGVALSMYTNKIVCDLNTDLGRTFVQKLLTIDGSWVFVTFTYTKNEKSRLYIDTDAPVVSTTISGTINETHQITIGTDKDLGFKDSALIDEVVWYNRALTQKEITQNYKAGINKHKASSSFSDDFSSDYGI